MSTDEIADAVAGISWSDVEDAVSDISLSDVEKVAGKLLAQTDTQRRRRGRGGRSKKRGGKSSWGKAARGAGKDAAKSIGTSMAEDAAWCAVGDPLNVVGCNSGGSDAAAPAESKSSSSWWFAQVEDE